MNNTRVCPACHKELPVLAVRCKYCGFRQPTERHSEGGDPADTAIHSIIQKPGKPSSNASTEAPEESPKPQNIVGNRRPRKETLKLNASKLASAIQQHNAGKMVASDADSPSPKKGLSTSTMKSRRSRSSRPPQPSPSEKKSGVRFARKKTAMGMGPLKSMPKQASLSVAGSPAGSPTGSPAGKAAASAPGAARENQKSQTANRPHVPTPSGPAPSPGTESSHQGDPDVSLIMSLDDDSSLVLLDSDESQALELDLGDVDNDQLTTELTATEIPDMAFRDAISESADSPSKTPLPKQWMTRVRGWVSLGMEKLRPIWYRAVAIGITCSATLTTLLRRIPLRMRIIAGAALIGLLGGILGIASYLSSENPRHSDAPAAGTHAQPSAPSTDTGHSAAPATGPATPETLNASKQCQPLSQYPDFPGKSEFSAILAQLGGDRLCAFMGGSLAGVQKGISAKFNVTRGAYDGIPDSTSLILRSVDGEGNLSYTLELASLSDRIFRLEIEYDPTGSLQPDMAAIARALDAETERRNGGEIAITDIIDQDLAIQWLVPPASAGPRMLTFTDNHSEVVNREQLDALEKAKSLVVKGRLQLDKQKNVHALDAFQSALEVNGHLGSAWVGRGNTQLRLEDFTGARAAAEKALTVSDDFRIHSLAEQVLAVIAIRNDDDESAIAHLKAAVKANPGNTDAATALKELKTGEYKTPRVAMTAARMSCPRHLNATVQGLLARGNFPDVQTFFDALQLAKQDVNFEPIKRKWVSRECR